MIYSMYLLVLFFRQLISLFEMIRCFVFFFKHKTAYELRISDWSSDVCSSDLDARLAPLDDPFEFARMQGVNSFIASSLHVAYAHGKRGSRWADDPAAQDAMKRKVEANMRMYFAMVEKDFLVGPWEIGRASCRERVCQSV